MPTIEVVVFPLAKGSDIGDPSNNAAKVMKENIDLIKKQKGCQGVHFGLQIEHPELLQLFIIWDSMDAHKAFMATEIYKPFQQRFGTILAGKPTICHVDFQPYSSVAKALSAPCTEIATFYHNGSPSSSYVEEALKIEPVLQEHADGYLGGALGVSHEEVEREGVKGHAGVLIIGWTSKEKHMAFRETGTFRENIGMLRGESEGLEMHHVQFMEAL